MESAKPAKFVSRKPRMRVSNDVRVVTFTVSNEDEPEKYPQISYQSLDEFIRSEKNLQDAYYSLGKFYDDLDRDPTDASLPDAHVDGHDGVRRCTCNVAESVGSCVGPEEDEGEEVTSLPSPIASPPKRRRIHMTGRDYAKMFTKPPRLR